MANISHSILAYPVSTGIELLVTCAASLSLPSESSWISTAPSPLLGTTTCGITGLEGLEASSVPGNPSHGYLSIEKNVFFRNVLTLKVKSHTASIN